MTVRQGFSKTIVLVVLLVIGAYVAVAYFGVTPHSVMDALRTTSSRVAQDVDTAAVDKAMEGGRQVVGRTLKSTGEQLLDKGQPAGTFAPYDAALVGSVPHTVIFFTAANCTACAAARMSFDSSRGSIPSSMIILEASYDYEELRNRYAVHEPATFILVDQSGTEVKRWTNTRTLSETLAAIPR